MKKGLLIVCLLLLALGVSACSGGAARPAADVASAVEAGQPFEEMTALEKAQALRYLDIDEAGVADLAMSIDASRATADTIAVITATDADALKTAQAALSAYRDSTLEQYRDYRPEEVPKLEGAVLKTKGLQTVLIVSRDAQAAETALSAAWK